MLLLKLYSLNLCQLCVFLCIFSKCFEVVVHEGAGTGVSSSPRKEGTLRRQLKSKKA